MKCCRKVYLDWGTGWQDVSHLVKSDTLTITKRAASNTYHKAQNYVSFTLIYEQVTFQAIYNATEKIKVQVVSRTTDSLFPSDTLYPDDLLFPMDENSTRILFTGIIPPTASRTYNGILNNTMLEMEGVDSQDLLDVEVEDWYLEDCTIMNPLNKSKSIIHQLAYIAGFTDSQIDQTIIINKHFDAFSPNNEKDKILTIMDILLFEHGYVFNMNAEDEISPVRWIGVPSSLFTFTEGTIVKEIKVKEKERKYDAIEITWYELSTMDDVRVYTESLPYASNGQFAGYPVPATYYYPVEANVTDRTTGSLTKVYQEYTDTGIEYKTNEAILNNLDYNYKAFDSDFSGIIITKNHELFDDREGLTLVASEFGNKKARILYRNNEATAQRLYYMYINATVTYKSSERILRAGLESTSELTDKYESYFIYDAESADILAQNMVQMYGAGNVEYEFDSEIEVPEGSFVNLITNDATNLTCFVTEKQYSEKTGLFSYVLVGYTHNEGVIISEETTRVGGAYEAYANALATDAYNQAIQALADAADAQSTADGKIESFFQPSQPVSGSEGDIWFDTDDGNKVYVYSTTSGWQDAQDNEIAEAISLATTASGIADGKSTTYYQASAPTGLGASDQGDLWVDIDEHNKTYAWSGSAWVLAQDWYTANALATDAYNQAIQALADASTAQSTADGKIESFFQPSQPVSGSEGDIWFDTDDGNKVYVYSTTSGWQVAQDSEIAEAINLATTASGIADGKSTTYYQASTPTGLGASDQGDLWVDTDANYKTYAWSGSAWVLAQDWYTANARVTTLSGTVDDLSDTVDTKITLAQVPEYRGRYLNSAPSTGNTSGDTCLVYSSTLSARGIYKYTTSWAKQTTPTMQMISNAWVDICAVTSAASGITGAPYGVVADYIGSQVNFIESLVANEAFIASLVVQQLKIANTGAIYGGDRYNSDGTDNDVDADGFWIGASGQIKAQNIVISSATNDTGRGVSVSNASTGYGVYVDNIDIGQGVYVNNASGGRGVSVYNSSTGRGVSVDNRSTGYGVYVSNTNTGYGVYVYNSSTGRGVSVANNNTGYGVYVANTGIGQGVYVNNNNTGRGVSVSNASTGYGVFVYNTGTGYGLYAESVSTSSTRKPIAKFVGNGVVLPYFDGGATEYATLTAAINALCPGTRENGQTLIIRWIQTDKQPTQRQQIAVYANSAWTAFSLS